MAINQKELNQNSNEVNLGNGVIENLKTQIKTLTSDIKAKNTEIKNKNAQIKSESDPAVKEGLKNDLNKLKEELSQLKFNLTQIKAQISAQKSAIDAKITSMINKEGNEDLKKYVLYTKGKVFDQNIGKYKKEENTINSVSELLEQREGAPANENKGRKDLSNALEKYIKAKGKCDEIKNACKITGEDFKVNSKYIEAVVASNKSKEELKAKFEALKDIVPLSSIVSYADFENIIEKLKMVDGKDVKGSIKEGLDSQSKIAQRNVKNNMKAIEEIIKDGKDMEVNFKGFSNYNSNVRTQPSILPTVPKKSFWEKVRHPIQWAREKKNIKEQREQIEEQQAIEAGYENYDESKYNFHDLKAIKPVHKLIEKEVKAKLHEIENERPEEEAETEEPEEER